MLWLRSSFVVNSFSRLLRSAFVVTSWRHDFYALCVRISLLVSVSHFEVLLENSTFGSSSPHPRHTAANSAFDHVQAISQTQSSLRCHPRPRPRPLGSPKSLRLDASSHRHRVALASPSQCYEARSIGKEVAQGFSHGIGSIGH